MSSDSTRVSDNGAPFTRTNFPTAEKFDRTLLSRDRSIFSLCSHLTQIFVRLRSFRMNGTTKRTNFQPVENSPAAVCMGVA